MVLKIIRVILLCVSCYGYICTLCKKIRVEFAVGIVFTSICSVMFFSGILNVLQEVAWLLFGIGLVLTIRSIERNDSAIGLCNFSAFFFGIVAIILFVVLYGTKLFEVDDFSHWATSLKVLITENRFPNFLDHIISFQSYPLGSASFLYYFVTITGITSEWFQLYMQAMYICGVLLGFFAFVMDWKGNLFASVTIVIMMFAIHGIKNLTVDTLLATIAVGGLLVCFYYRRNFQDYIYYMIPYIVSLIAVKNSGILFALFIICLELWYIQKNKDAMVKFSISLVFPFSALLLWQKHVSYVFERGLESKHSMAIENIASTFQKKAMDDILAIIKVFVQETFSLKNEFLYLFCLVAVLVVITNSIKFENTKDVNTIASYFIATYIVYIIGFLGMYLTTMPIGESLRLAGYSRYHRTMLMFSTGIVYLIVTETIRYTRQQNRHNYNGFLVYFLTTCICLKVFIPGLWYNNTKYNNSMRADFEALLVSNNVEPEQKYMIILDQENKSVYKGYFVHLVRYLLDSTDVLICNPKEYRDSGHDRVGYDYLIVYGESDEIVDFLLEEYNSVQNRVFTK